MIRDLWAKISFRGRSKKQDYDSDVVADEASDSSAGSVVPFHKNDKRWDQSEPALITKNDSAEKVNEAVNRLVEKLEGIHEHLGKQNEHNEQLLEKISRLPDLIHSLPEAAKRQEQAIRTLINDLRAKSVRDGELMEFLSRLPGESAKQGQTLKEIHGQLGKVVQKEGQMTEQFARASEALDKLDQSTAKQTEWVEQMSKSFAVSDRYLRYTLIRQQKQFYWILGISIVLSLAALAGLGIVLFMMNKG